MTAHFTEPRRCRAPRSRDKTLNSQAKTNTDATAAAPSQLVHLLHRAGQGGDELFLNTFRDHTLTPRQFAVLVAAQNRDEPSQAALVSDTGIDRSTLADIVGRLVAKGMLERQRTKRDARAYAIRVTDQGRNTIADLTPRFAQMERQILSVLPENDRLTFVKNLEVIVQSIKEIG